MLNENIKNLRKSKGLSQEELAIKLNVVRQTVSKWEAGYFCKCIAWGKQLRRYKDNCRKIRGDESAACKEKHGKS